MAGSMKDTISVPIKATVGREIIADTQDNNRGTRSVEFEVSLPIPTRDHSPHKYVVSFPKDGAIEEVEGSIDEFFEARPEEALVYDPVVDHVDSRLENDKWSLRGHINRRLKNHLWTGYAYGAITGAAAVSTAVSLSKELHLASVSSLSIGILATVVTCSNARKAHDNETWQDVSMNNLVAEAGNHAVFHTMRHAVLNQEALPSESAMIDTESQTTS